MKTIYPLPNSSKNRGTNPAPSPLFEATIAQLLDHAEELRKLDARLFLSQADLKRLLGVSDDQASKLFRGPLWGCTVPVGEVHRRIYLPALLHWMEEHLGASLCRDELR